MRREVARHAEFAATVEQITEVNEEICEARPAAGSGCALRRRRGKRGLCAALAQEKAAEIGRLAAEAARSLGCGDAGLEAAEAVIRAGMLKLGGGMLGQLLAADPGYRGPRVPCGQGHEAEFVAYRDKVIDTVLGPVTLTPRLVPLRGLRARASRRGTPSSAWRARPCRPGLAAMNDLAAAAGPFAKAAAAAGGPGRGPADRQARRAGRRGQRRRRGRRRPGPGRG